MDLSLLGEELQRTHGIRILGNAESVGGGSISRAMRLQSDQGMLFVKLNRRSESSMFEAEAAGLAALAAANAVRVPAVIGVGTAADVAYLVVEWLDLAPKTPVAEAKLGRALAAQHRVTGAEFGWDRDNTIGATPQVNAPLADWPAFFCERRIRFQLSLAERNGLPAETRAGVERVVDATASLLDGHTPAASLLHGDLWGGNWGATVDDAPVIFDPAVYYGDREADLAMTRLFGGFGPAFYDAYAEAWPLAPGWERRVDLYNLYHLLNHFNLFGAGYLAAVRAALARLLDDIP